MIISEEYLKWIILSNTDNCGVIKSKKFEILFNQSVKNKSSLDPYKSQQYLKYISNSAIR
jgi:hypothetical protein